MFNSIKRTHEASLRALEMRECLRRSGGARRWSWEQATLPSSDVSDPIWMHLVGNEIRLPGGCEVLVSLQDTQIGEIVSYRFSPSKPTGWVVLLHGYMLHALCLNEIIACLVDHGYGVLAPDWPGHGLSAGDRASISSFSDYSTVIEDLLNAHQDLFSCPPHLIAHSTGCSAWLEFRRSHAVDPFDQVILVSPLIRSALWHWGKTGTQLFGRLLPSVPRVFRNSSSDHAYLLRMKQDPLAPWVVPMNWSRALIAWESSWAFTRSDSRILDVFQGNRDSVVDWRFGLQRLQHVFPQVRIQIWEGQLHDLLNESLPVRNEVFQRILEVLQSRS
jgi:alpha-beta hydrolase superfamily lysophospholipase